MTEVDVNDKPYEAMNHDEILREHAARYQRMTLKERLQQKDAFLKLPGKEPETGVNAWTRLYLAGTAVVFGYWQNNVAAGVFVFLALTLLTRLIYIVTNNIIRVGASVASVEELVSDLRLQDPIR